MDKSLALKVKALIKAQSEALPKAGGVFAEPDQALTTP
jgi:hypothetical protein